MAKYSLIGLVFLSLVVDGAAYGADLTPIYNTSTSFSWAGPYVGGFGAYGWADPRGGFSLSSASLAALPPIIPVIDVAGSQRLAIDGAAIGADAGYNWQLSPQLVAGLEGDAEWSDFAGRHVVGGTVPVFDIPFAITQSLKADWQTSIRLRVGLTPFDRVLVYATGGPALAHLSYSSSYFDPVPEIENKSLNEVRGGFAVGVGAEYALSTNWSLKTEYLYSRFSAASGTGSGVLADGTTAFIAHSTGALNESSLRFGVNYRFP